MATTSKTPPVINPSAMTESEKREFLLTMRRISGTSGKSKKLPAPTTNDELHHWILVETGYDIPRVAVCEDHCAPFDYVADYYFERESAILVIGGRESAKTLNTAIANYVFAETKPGCEICTFADIEAQSNKSYSYIKSFVYTTDANGKKVVKPTVEGLPLRKETLLKNGSKLEVIIGTLSGVNSPHPQKVHADEVDLQDKEIFAESRNMSSSRTFPDGRVIKAQDIATSTLKSTKGIVQGLVDETEKSKREGLKPTWKIYKACFTPDTLVRTDIGYIPIRSVYPGMKVLSKNGIFRNVIATSKKSHKNNIINLRSSSGLNIKCTEDHKICGIIDSYTLAPVSKPKSRKKYGFKEDFIEAEYLEVGNYIRTEFLNKESEIDREYIYPPKDTFSHSESKNIFDYGYCQCGCGGKPKIATHTRGESTRGKPNSYLPGHHFIRKYHESYKLNDDFLWAIGMYCAEGHSSQGAITYSLHGDEVKYINRLKRIFEALDFNVSIKYRKNDKGAQVIISSTQLSEWFDTWIGIGCDKKEIPYELLNLPLYKVLRVAEGVLDGDGSYRWDSLNQTSPILALQMSEISHRYNGRATIVKNKKKNRKECFIVNNFFSDVAKGRKTSLFFEHKNHRGFWNYEEHKYSKVVESKKEFYEGDVYDLTIEDEPYYVVGNTLVHNCVFEVAKEVPNCRSAPKELREARLKELGKDPCELCECNKVAKDEWAEKMPRTLDTVCKGKFFKSRGWMPHEDVIRKFVQNTTNKWASQLECRRPMADGLYLPSWNREKFCIRGYEPRPEYGLLWLGCDWGGSEASFVVWIQGPLHQPIQVNNTVGSMTVIPQGGYVIFKELTEAAMGATRLADKVVRQEISFRNRFPGWRVKARFADMAGRQQRDDWREHNPPLRTVWYISRDFEPTVECLQSLVADNLLYADDQNAPAICDDFESWRMKDGKEVHDSSSHGPAAARYCLKNVQTIVKRYRRSSLDTIEPVVAGRDSGDNLGSIAVGHTSNDEAGTDIYGSERWRQSLGSPVISGEEGKPRWMP